MDSCKCLDVTHIAPTSIAYEKSPEIPSDDSCQIEHLNIKLLIAVMAVATTNEIC